VALVRQRKLSAMLVIQQAVYASGTIHLGYIDGDYMGVCFGNYDQEDG
jgi:hypothetical protein